MQESRVRSLGWEDPLEKQMAPHSSILAWRIPWTEEPGGLQSMGSPRVRHGWVTLTHTHPHTQTHTHTHTHTISLPLLRTGNRDNRSVTSAVRSRRGGGGEVMACTLVSGLGDAGR